MTLPAMFVLSIALGLASFGSAQDGDAAKKDPQAFQGTWKVTKVLGGGKALPEDLVKQLVVTIEGDKYSMKFAGQVLVESTFKLDATKTPRQIDMTYISGPDKGQVSPGIYELEGDSLKTSFFLSIPSDKKRPAGFDDQKSGLTSVTVMERQKK